MEKITEEEIDRLIAKYPDIFDLLEIPCEEKRELIRWLHETFHMIHDYRMEELRRVIEED